MLAFIPLLFYNTFIFIIVFIFDFYAQAWDFLLNRFCFLLLLLLLLQTLSGSFVSLTVYFYLFFIFGSLFPLSHDSRFNSSLSKTLFLNDILKSTNERRRKQIETTWTLSTNGIRLFWFLFLLRFSMRICCWCVWVIFNGNSKYRVQKAFIVRVTKNDQIEAQKE